MRNKKQAAEVVGVLVSTNKANDAQRTFFNLLKPVDADSLLASASIRKINARLEETRGKGYSGWQSSACTPEALKARLQSAVDREDYLDAAILALMLEQREELGLN